MCDNCHKLQTHKIMNYVQYDQVAEFVLTFLSVPQTKQMWARGSIETQLS